MAALQDLVARGAVVAFDSQHVDGDPDFSSLGFYEESALEDAMLGGLRMVGTVDEASDEDGLREYAAGLRWYISPSGTSVDYSCFRGVCFFPPELIWNQGVYLPMPQSPLA
jgi:hypothetical protein